MEAVMKKIRFIRLNLIRLRDEMEGVCKKINCESLAVFETLLESEFRGEFNNFGELVMEAGLLLEDSNPDHDKIRTTLFDYKSEVSRINANYTARLKNFTLELQSNREKKSGESNCTLGTGQPKLKRIDVPTFDGKLINFFNFKQLFVSLVHDNPELSNVQKLYYLKQSLIGEASEVVRDFDLIESAYPQAWSYFLSRFENRRAIICAHFRNLKNLESVKNETEIRNLLNNVNSVVRGLKACGENIDSTFSRFIAYYVSTKLDFRTAREWEHSLTSVDQFPTFDLLETFLQNRSFAVEDRLRETNSIFASRKDGKSPASNKKSFFTFRPICELCAKPHSLYQCESFRAKDVLSRYQFVKQNNLCLICFSPTHKVKECKSKFRCKCGKNHSQLLHFRSNVSSELDSRASYLKEDSSADCQPSKNPVIQTNSQVKTSLTCQISNFRKIVLLPSAVVKFYCNGITGSARVLLDSCSQATMVSDAFIQKYKLSTMPVSSNIAVKGVGPFCTPIKSMINLDLISRINSFHLNIDADVVPACSITYSANFELPETIFNRLRELELADTAFAREDKNISILRADIILGAEYYENCMADSTRSLDRLSLRLTKFGWVTSGIVPQIDESTNKFSGCTIKDLSDSLRKFWEIEEITQRPKSLNEKDRCAEYFENTYSVGNDGKFIVRLPFKHDRASIANNRAGAVSNFLRLERRLNNKTKSLYEDFMREYEAMNHMSLVQPTNNTAFYIPHREVIRSDSTTTPLRVVFNASAKERNQKSLNECLMIGPVIQNDLFEIILSMRVHKFCFCADIEKMYRMIWVHEDDRDMQRIFWRENTCGPIREYRLNTVTYGTASASFLAAKCLSVISTELSLTHSQAARVIAEHFYMDDLVTGADSEEEMSELRNVIHDALSRRGFLLRKYLSNSESFLRQIEPHLLTQASTQTFGNGVAVLGLNWNPGIDKFRIQLNIESFSPKIGLTKRIILSYISKTFDPLGFLSPVTVRGKLLLKSVWQEGRSWDELVSEDIKKAFRSYMSDLEKLRDFETSRYIGSRSGRKMVAFCDASEKAYCAVVYLLSTDDCNIKKCKLVCSKTRIAPMRALTIPKLELLAASLLADLVNRTMKILKIPLEDVLAFSDSTVVLCWLSQPSDNWKIFVGNRVEKIVNIIPFNRWNYVNTKDNPADLATRGLEATEFLNSGDLWINGPCFLREPDPCSYYTLPNVDLHKALEKRKIKIALSVTIVDDIINKFSSYQCLLRVVAYILRLLEFCKKKTKADRLVVTTSEFRNAFTFVIRHVQRSSYAEDIDRLKRLTYFWRRWSKDYINQLQQRHRWQTPTPNLPKDQLVLIKNENVRPFEWPLGVVVDAIPGNDGLVRVVNVRTQHGIRTRAISSLIVLPIGSESFRPQPGEYVSVS